MISRVSYLQQLGARREILLLTFRVMRKLASVFWPLYAFFLVAGKEFLTVLYTSSYSESWPIFAVYITLLPMNILVNDPVLRAYAEHRYFLLKIRVLLLGALLFGLWAGISRLGMIGAVWAVVGVAMVERVAITCLVVRTLRMKAADLVLLKDVFRLALVAAAAAGVTAFARSFCAGQPPLLTLAVCGVVFAASYCGGVLLWGIATDEELSLVSRRFARLRGRAAALGRSS
jgi:O-antigen/teichoic acid export membrane protein